MKRTFLLAAGTLLLLAAGHSGHATPQPRSKAGRPQTRAASGPPRATISHVILISVDGLMPSSYTDPDAQGLRVPTLREMVQNGAASPGVRGVFPTVTYPSHTSMATGARPRTHGIFSNVVFDPLGTNEGGWYWYAEDIRAPALWDAARAKGLRTALISWPATLGAQADFVVPEFWRPGNDGAKLLRSVSTPGLLADVAQQYPNLFDGLTPPNVNGQSLFDIHPSGPRTRCQLGLLLHQL